MQCKLWIKGNDLAMILVQYPVRDKGISLLKKKKEVWNWLPTFERNIKLPPSMMSQSWMGTDFTNDEVLSAFRARFLRISSVTRDKVLISQEVRCLANFRITFIWAGMS